MNKLLTIVTIHINPKAIPLGIDRNKFGKFREEYWINRAKNYYKDGQ